MTRATTTRQVQELYSDSAAATRQSLEGLASSISKFREAVRHIAENQAEPISVSQQLEQARRRRQSAQRRVMLEWVAAMALCVALLLPGIGYYRDHAARQRQQQQKALQQREADSALLDQVASEISEEVPDSMRPLTEQDSDYAGKQISTGETEKTNGEN